MRDKPLAASLGGSNQLASALQQLHLRCLSQLNNMHPKAVVVVEFGRSLHLSRWVDWDQVGHSNGTARGCLPLRQPLPLLKW